MLEFFLIFRSGMNIGAVKQKTYVHRNEKKQKRYEYWCS